MAEKFVVKYGVVTQNIDFQSPDHNNTITAEMFNTDVLTFSGDVGTLLSIADTTSGTIFTVNDSNGNGAIDVDADGTIRIAESAGNILIGTANDNGTDKVQVDGTVRADNFAGNG